jgi:hypothetical protein
MKSYTQKVHKHKKRSNKQKSVNNQNCNGRLYIQKNTQQHSVLKLDDNIMTRKHDKKIEMTRTHITIPGKAHSFLFKNHLI